MKLLGNLLAPPLYLSSTKKNDRLATKITNRQLVSMSSAFDVEAVWMFTMPSRGRLNSAECFLSQGSPVDIRQSVQLTHRQTSCFLTLDENQRDNTDFGVEIECYADRMNQFGKLSLVSSETKGMSTVNTLRKPDAPIYNWHVVTSSSSSSCEESSRSRALPPVATDDNIVQEMRRMIVARGVDGFWDLRAFFMSGDPEFDGKVDRVDLKDGLVYWGITIDPRYLSRVIENADRYQNGIIDFSSFIATLRGPQSAARLSLISRTYDAILDRTSSKVNLPVDAVQPLFTGATHPLLRDGRLSSAAKAFDHMLSFFRVRGSAQRPAFVTKKQFTEYYEDLSAATENDDDFADMLRGSWSV